MNKDIMMKSECFRLHINVDDDIDQYEIADTSIEHIMDMTNLNKKEN